LRALICAAEASVARDPVQGWRDVAIVRVLADAGLRCEELLGLERRDFLPKRKGAKSEARLLGGAGPPSVADWHASVLSRMPAR